MDFKTIATIAAVAIVIIVVLVIVIKNKKDNSGASFYGGNGKNKGKGKPAPAKKKAPIDENIHPEITMEIRLASKEIIKLFESTIGDTSTKVIKKTRKYAQEHGDPNGGYPEGAQKMYQSYRMTLFGEPRHVFYLEFKQDENAETVERCIIYLDKNYGERYREALKNMFGVPYEEKRVKGQYNTFLYKHYKDGKFRLTFTESEVYGGCSLMLESKKTKFDETKLKVDIPDDMAAPVESVAASVAAAAEGNAPAENTPAENTPAENTPAETTPEN